MTTSYDAVVSYDPETGRELWRSEGFLGNAVPTAVASRTTVFVVSGYPDKLTKAIRIPAGGEPPAVLWEYKKGTGYTPSPLLFRDYLYLVSDNGLLTCLDPETGRVIYEGGRFPVPSFVRASPVAWEDRILLAGEEGDIAVVRAGPVHEVLSVNSIGEPIIASPAIAGGRLFVRGASHLYAIGSPRALISPAGLSQGLLLVPGDEVVDRAGDASDDRSDRGSLLPLATAPIPAPAPAEPPMMSAVSFADRDFLTSFTSDAGLGAGGRVVS